MILPIVSAYTQIQNKISISLFFILDLLFCLFLYPDCLTFGLAEIQDLKERKLGFPGFLPFTEIDGVNLCFLQLGARGKGMAGGTDQSNSQPQNV